MGNLNRRWFALSALSLGLMAGSAIGLKAFSDVPRGALPTATSPARSDQEVLSHASRALNEIATKAVPAVVSISTLRPAASGHGMMGLPFDGSGSDDAPDLFGGSPPGGGSKKDGEIVGLGSGAIIRPDGLILTNNHVVENAERVTVTLDDKHKFPARVVGTDPKTDLALIQLEKGPKSLPTIPIGDSDRIAVGDWAIAIGSPFGLNRSVSFGIISAKGRAQMGILDTEDFIQTDAAINPGSSGGPLLNSNGEIIGVNTAIFSQGGGFMGIGFAVPSKIAKEVTENIITHGRMIRGWVGLMAQDLDDDLAKYFKSGQQGALVDEVVPGGPGSKASVKVGDVITRYDGHPVDGASTLKSLVGRTKVGSDIPVDLLREGKAFKVDLKVLEQPEVKSKSSAQKAGQLAQESKHADAHPKLGVSVQDVPQEIAQFLKMPSRTGTLVVGVEPGSPAFDAGLGPGDIILRANQTEVHGAKDFQRMTKDLHKDDVAVFYVQHGPEEKIFVPVKMNPLA